MHFRNLWAIAFLFAACVSQARAAVPFTFEVDQVQVAAGTDFDLTFSVRNGSGTTDHLIDAYQFRIDISPAFVGTDITFLSVLSDIFPSANRSMSANTDDDAGTSDLVTTGAPLRTNFQAFNYLNSGGVNVPQGGVLVTLLKIRLRASSTPSAGFLNNLYSLTFNPTYSTAGSPGGAVSLGFDDGFVATPEPGILACIGIPLATFLRRPRTLETKRPQKKNPA